MKTLQFLDAVQGLNSESPSIGVGYFGLNPVYVWVFASLVVFTAILAFTYGVTYLSGHQVVRRKVGIGIMVMTAALEAIIIATGAYFIFTN